MLRHEPDDYAPTYPVGGVLFRRLDDGSMESTGSLESRRLRPLSETGTTLSTGSRRQPRGKVKADISGSRGLTGA
jgi:hypothetical protein